jgi:hypothetical protein
MVGSAPSNFHNLVEKPFFDLNYIGLFFALRTHMQASKQQSGNLFYWTLLYGKRIISL